jgi:hypothetical protein
MNKLSLPSSERNHVWKRGENNLLGFFPNKTLGNSLVVPFIVILVLLFLLFEVNGEMGRLASGLCSSVFALRSWMTPL